MNPRQLLVAAITILAIAVGLGIGLVTDDEPAAPHTTLDVPVPGPDQKVTVDRDNQLEAGELDEAKRSEPGGGKPSGKPEPIDLHEDTRDETPAGVTRDQVLEGREKAKRIQERAPRSQKLRAPKEPAGAQAYSCPAAHVVNQSALSSRRYGVALHFTVSQPGSLNAIRGLFNRPSFGASSNYGFELFNLRCQEWVPVGRKAWAQGAFNSHYVSIEIISNDRSRASWLATPALRYGVLAALVRDLLKRTGAPARRVNPSGCTPLAGVTDHDALECGNSHWDVGPGFPWDVFMRQVRQGAPQTANVLSKTERRLTSRRCYHRAEHLAGRKRQANLRWSSHYIRRIGGQRLTLRRLGLTTKHQRKLRHRILGGYVQGKACRR